jgi:hypothetical protein
LSITVVPASTSGEWAPRFVQVEALDRLLAQAGDHRPVVELTSDRAPRGKRHDLARREATLA